MALCVLSHLYVSYKKMAAKKKLANAYRRENFDPKDIKQDLAFFQNLLSRVHPDQISTFPLAVCRSENDRKAIMAHRIARLNQDLN